MELSTLLSFGVVLVATSAHGVEEPLCRATATNSFIKLNDWTPYELADSDVNAKLTELPGCKLVKFWMLARHGTRNPLPREARKSQPSLYKLKERVREAYEAGKSSLCEEDYRRIQMWETDPDLLQNLGGLPPAGHEDMVRLSNRLKIRYPSIFASNRPESDFEYFWSRTVRTQKSGDAFIGAVLGKDGKHLGKYMHKADYFVGCAKYVNLRRSDMYLAEPAKFNHGPEMKELAKRVTKRLGLLKELTYDEVTDMHVQCGFEYSWRWYGNKQSPWCAAFTEEDIEVLKYKRDLREYYHSAYGFDFMPQMGCYLFRDMIEMFKNKTENISQGPDVRMYFTHDTLLDQFYSHLDLFKDETPLRADNFLQQKNRKWQIGNFLPFGAHIDAAFYDCSGEYKMQFFINEKPHKFEGCADTVCSWQEFMASKGDDELKTCDIDAICRDNGEGYNTVHPGADDTSFDEKSD